MFVGNSVEFPFGPYAAMDLVILYFTLKTEREEMAERLLDTNCIDSGSAKDIASLVCVKNLDVAEFLGGPGLIK